MDLHVTMTKGRPLEYLSIVRIFVFPARSIGTGEIHSATRKAHCFKIANENSDTAEQRERKKERIPSCVRCQFVTRMLNLVILARIYTVSFSFFFPTSVKIVEVYVTQIYIGVWLSQVAKRRCNRQIESCLSVNRSTSLSDSATLRVSEESVLL